MSRRRTGDSQLSLFGGPAPAPEGIVPAPHAERLRGLGERLPPSLRLGTSSWSFPGWKGLVYEGPVSETRLAREGLAAYGKHPLFRTVGVDRTYYAPVPAKDLAAYAEQVPPDFRFLVKAHEHCTLARFPQTARYGAHRGEANPRFLDPAYAVDRVVGPFVEGLGEKGGPLLFQLPPQPLSELTDFPDRLHAFLRALPKGPLYAVELRNGKLLTPAYLDALADVGAVHCLNVHSGMIPIEEQIARVRPERGPAVVIRWMLRSGYRYESAADTFHPFEKLVDEDPGSRTTIADLARAVAAMGIPTWVIVNNKAEGSSPLSIENLARLLTGYME